MGEESKQNITRHHTVGSSRNHGVREVGWMSRTSLGPLCLWPSLILTTVYLNSYQVGLSSAELYILVNGMRQIFHWYKMCDLSQHIPSSWAAGQTSLRHLPCTSLISMPLSLNPG